VLCIITILSSNRVRANPSIKRLKGSASLKAVLPAITGKGYENLDISTGQLASFAFLTATYGKMPEADKAKVMSDLEDYCGRDTEGMIWIVERLKELSK